jgi:hydrogenase maturation protease
LKLLVLGLGNPILTDDGVGIYVSRQAAERSRLENVSFAEASVGGLRLLDILSGYDRVVLVDAIQTANGRPGDVVRLHPNDVRASMHLDSTHDLSFPAALALGRSLGMALPADEDIIILAVEADDVLTFGEQCTPSVAAAIPRVVETVLAEIAKNN